MSCQFAGRVYVIAGSALLCVLACKPPQQQAPPPPKPPEVTISQVVERSVTDFEDFTGRLEATETVEIHARVRGYLNAVHFTDGQEVKTGTPLFDIDPRTYEAELKNAEGLKAQWMAKRDKAKADVARYEGLVPTGAASAQDLDKARAELGEAIAAIQSAEAAIDHAKLDLEFAKITAPIDGQVGRALITKGNLVQTGVGQDSLLTTIVSLDPMYVYFDVDERTLLRFRERHRTTTGESRAPESVADLKVPLQMGLADESGFSYHGYMNFADNRVDETTGTIRVRGTFDNSKRIFKPGLFARVRLACTEPYPAVLVADAAIGTDQGTKYVLTVNDQNTVERRLVKLGPLQDDGLRVVTDGLKSGEWIITNGIQRARAGKPVTPQKADMPSRQVKSTKSPAVTKPVTTQPAAPSGK